MGFKYTEWCSSREHDPEVLRSTITRTCECLQKQKHRHNSKFHFLLELRKRRGRRRRKNEKKAKQLKMKSRNKTQSQKHHKNRFNIWKHISKICLREATKGLGKGWVFGGRGGEGVRGDRPGWRWEEGGGLLPATAGKEPKRKLKCYVTVRCYVTQNRRHFRK